MSKLAKMDSAHADSPETFAADMAMLKQQLDLKVIAGCCGTSTEHLRAIAKVCSISLTIPYKTIHIATMRNYHDKL